MASGSQGGPDMNTKAQPERFVVLAALDGILSDRVALVAARLAADIAGGELHLLQVLGLPPASGAQTAATLAEARGRLQRVGVSAQEIHTGRIVAHLAAGDPCHE